MAMHFQNILMIISYLGPNLPERILFPIYCLLISSDKRTFRFRLNFMSWFDEHGESPFDWLGEINSSSSSV